MAYRYLNANPNGLTVGDCVIRAISLATGIPWMYVHEELCDLSRTMYDMPSSNRVWKRYLETLGFREHQMENTCPDCFTVDKFTRLNPYGIYILSTCEISKAQNIFVTGSHVVAVMEGDYYDTWDSGLDIPLSYFIIK